MGRQWYIDHAVKFARWKHPVMGLGARFAVLHHLFQVLFYDFGVFAKLLSEFGDCCLVYDTLPGVQEIHEELRHDERRQTEEHVNALLQVD